MATPPAPTPPARTPDLADSLRLAVTRLARRLRQHADVSASPTQVAALSTIERRGPLTLGELAACERVRPPTVTAAVSRLEARDLVRRTPDPTDRRVARVEITAAGRKLLARTRSRKTAFLAQRLGALDARERAVLAEAVVVLDHLLDEEGRP
jgi:DNA-binding MarR family transcriptional regulator